MLLKRGGEAPNLVFAAKAWENGLEVSGVNLLHCVDQTLDWPRHTARHYTSDAHQNQPDQNRTR